MKVETKEKIIRSLQETKQRRKQQIPKTFQLKLQNLSKRDIRLLDRLFLEAKWFYNWLIEDISRLQTTRKVSEVTVKTPSGIETRRLELLSSTRQEEIKKRIVYQLKSLKALKSSGNKIGHLRFKSKITSIPIGYHNKSFKIDFDRNRIKLQKIRKSFRVLGIRQIPSDAEIANGFLIKRPSGYYVNITCYIPKESNKVEPILDKPIGIDFGVKNQVTLSNGITITWRVPESKRLKRLQRQLMRKKKGSNNYNKCKLKIQKEYEKLTRIKRDIQNRIISLLKHYNVVIIQDENIRGWSKRFGRNIQMTGIGRIVARLKDYDNTIVIERFYPTTQECCNCSNLNHMNLSDRVYRCRYCRLEIDRDLNSSINMVKSGLKLENRDITEIPNWWKLTKVEKELLDRIFNNKHICVNIDVT